MLGGGGQIWPKLYLSLLIQDLTRYVIGRKRVNLDKLAGGVGDVGSNMAKFYLSLLLEKARKS